MTEVLWRPSKARIESSNMYKFMQRVNQQFNQKFDGYADLYRWSIENIPDFWSLFWDFADIKASRGYLHVVDDLSKMPGAKWFQGARLNFAENLLRFRDDRPALIFKSEGRPTVKWTYKRLYEEVSWVAKTLRGLGVKPGDRIAGFMPNMPQTTVAMLAAASLGAVWTSCSPDFGVKGVWDRLGQIKPKILFSADGYLFKGKVFDCLERVAEIIQVLPAIEKVFLVPYVGFEPDFKKIPKAICYDEIMGDGPAPELSFTQLPFDHPLYIMYSSGTTGLPKCMVQSTGGILLNHLKELLLHTDIKRNDVVFYFTTCGWMMWNWLQSALALGASLVLYDGNPFFPAPDTLWQLAEDEKITVFGTSAGYLNALENSGYQPGRKHELEQLRTVLSTGSPLSAESFKFVYSSVKEDVQLASIAGGTDLNGCFALGNPMDPVYTEEIQGRGLAMKVEAFDENGRSVLGRKGELVCAAPFPSMPIYFWDDPDGSKYHAAYFDVYPNVWRHGDFVEINDHGGVIIYGRSDATLNPGGVRIGTAEIYRQVDRFDEVEDSLVVGQDWNNDVRVILFVKTSDGNVLDDSLKARLIETIRRNASPRHVPAMILSAPDIPYTLNMKKVELAVKRIIQGEPVLNRDALLNPDVLDYFAGLKELQRD